MKTESTPLQQTIWNLAMNGGSVKDKRNGEIVKITLSNFDEIISFSSYFVPILHSLKKLTETVLEGGKVPIVELAKMAFPNGGWVTTTESQTATNIKSFNKDKFTYRDGSFSCREANLNGNHHKVPNQDKLFDQLRQWGFNIENLKPDEFIEKSTLKL